MTTNNGISDDRTPVDINELLAIVGELYVQARIHQKLIGQLRGQINAIERQSEIPHNYHEEREESKTGF